MSDTDIKDKIKRYILDQFLPGEDPANLEDTTELITGGVLESLATLKLVAFLEDNYGIKVQPHELGVDNLNTITDIANFVASKRS